MKLKKVPFLFCCSMVASALFFAGAPLAAQAASFTSDRWIGAYEPGAPQSVAPLTALEGQIGTHIEVANAFRSVEQKFTDDEVDRVASHGSIPLITLEICAEGESSDVTQPNYSLKRIAAGGIDGVLRTYADGARKNGHEIWIRPFHEMNGFWYPWCGTTNGNTPTDFINAWRHVHDVFAQEGATNVKFVWCPNIESLHKDSSGKIVLDNESSAANRIAAYYPGDDYVDYMALDGYNPSTTLSGCKWRSFTSLFAAPYATLSTKCSTTKPIFIAETASVSVGGDKPAWISDMFRVIPTSYPRIVGVSWFNQASQSPRQDWPVDSSAAALQAFRLGVANGVYSPGLELTPVHTSLSLKTNMKSVRCRRAIKFSGVLKPGQYHDIVRVVVAIPKRRGSYRAVFTSRSAAWSMRYTPSVRGVYHVRVTYAGDSTRLAGASKWVKFVVK